MRSLSLAVLLCLDLVLLCSTGVSTHGTAAVLLFLLPGFLLGQILFQDVGDAAATFSLSAGSAFLCALFFLFALQALPGVPSSQDLIIALNLLTAACAWRNTGKLSVSQHVSGTSLCAMLLVVGAAVLRLTSLGSAEYQGDEARAVILASGVSSGQYGILFMHKKGPAEALFAAPELLLSGTTSEFSTRLPFSLAGIVSILALFALVRAFDQKRYSGAALVASALLCLDGFHVAFSRIVQYQSTLVFFLLCAALCALKLRQHPVLAKRYSSACAALCAAALLCHYDAGLAFPAIAILLWSSYSSIGYQTAGIIRALVLPGAQFLVLSSAFYLPFFLSEHFTNTAGYLSQRIGANKLPTNNIPRYLDLLSFYGGEYLTYLVYIALGVALIVWSSRPLGKRPYGIATALCLGLLALNALPSWSFLLLALPICLLLWNRALTLPQTTFLLWSWTGLTVLGFFFARPNTHFYVIHPANAALGGIFLSEIYQMLRDRNLKILQWGLVAALTAIALLSANYLRIAYLTPGIEYRFAFSKVRPFLFPGSFKEGLPAGAYFGFQHRSGWKVIGALAQNGDLTGTYASNEEELITAWYARGLTRTPDSPDYFFIAVRPKDPVKVSQSKIEHEYAFWGRIYVDDRRSLDVYRRKGADTTPRRLDLSQFEATFDLAPANTLDARAELLNAVSR